MIGSYYEKNWFNRLWQYFRNIFQKYLHTEENKKAYEKQTEGKEKQRKGV